jgi:hypothetical protein
MVPMNKNFKTRLFFGVMMAIVSVVYGCEKKAGIAWDTTKNIALRSDYGEPSVKGIAWGNNKFVAVGYSFKYHDEPDLTNGLIAYSSDGINWTSVKNTSFGGIPSSINDIAFGKDKFVAVGDYGKIAYSPDGVNWTAVTNNPFDSSGIADIAWGEDKFVAGGRNGKMAYSLDGVNWTAVTNSPFNSYIRSIAWGNNKFVASSGSGEIAYSPDGINWTAAKDAPGSTTIVWGKDKFVAGVNIWEEEIGLYGKIMYSSDGINWTAMMPSPLRNPNEDYTHPIHKIAWGNNMFIAVGGDLDVVIMAYSPDGINWTFEDFFVEKFEKRPPFDDHVNVDALTWINGRFAAGDTRGRIMFSK